MRQEYTIIKFLSKEDSLLRQYIKASNITYVMQNLIFNKALYKHKKETREETSQVIKDNITMEMFFT
jgi:hypothetical protein